MALSGDGKRVVTGSWDKTASLWDAASGKKLQTFAGHTNLIRGVALSGDGKHVLTGSADNTAILWEAASGKKLQTFEGHKSVVTCVAFSGDGKHVLTGSYDATAILWDAASGKKLQTYPGVVLSCGLERRRQARPRRSELVGGGQRQEAPDLPGGRRRSRAWP